MKQYIQPNIKVKEIELEDMIAASPGTPSSTPMSSEEDIIENESGFDAKQNSASSVWDE